jgi:hypothetical protein
MPTPRPLATSSAQRHTDTDDTDDDDDDDDDGGGGGGGGGGPRSERPRQQCAPVAAAGAVAALHRRMRALRRRSFNLKARTHQRAHDGVYQRAHSPQQPAGRDFDEREFMAYVAEKRRRCDCPYP